MALGTGDNLGVGKTGSGYGSTGLYNVKRVAEIADIAYVLDLTNLNEQSFLALNELNNTILLEWLDTALKADDRYWLHINEVIDNQYRMKLNSTTTGITIDPL